MRTLTRLPSISRLSESVIRILGCNEGIMTLQGTNTYLVGTGCKRILIDAGEEKTASEYTKVLGQVLKEEKTTIEHLVVTHWHPDHLGGVNAVQDLLKRVSNTGICSTVWKLPRAPEDKEISNIEKKTSWQNLKHQQIIEVEGAKIRVEYTPGHTSDHASFMLMNDNVLFSGDCILGEGTAIFDDLFSYIASLKQILAMKPKLIYPGHGPVVTDPETVINHYITHRLKRENEILDVLGKNGMKNTMSEKDIVKHIYMDTSKIMWDAATYSIERHLTKLLREGRVKGEKGKWQSV